jgi:hypothetical protein
MRLSSNWVGGEPLCAVKMSAILDGEFPARVLPRAPIEGGR